MALGGNAPVMARRFALEGADVLLAAKMSKSFNEDSHESIKVTGEDILDDDIHLILVKKIHFLKEFFFDSKSHTIHTTDMFLLLF